MDSLHEEEQKKVMLRNTYTRGQIDLFIRAEKKFGLNDILDWMRWGLNPRLTAANLEDIRNVDIPRNSPTATAARFGFYANPPQPRPAPNRLLLKGISLSADRPLALINDQSLAAGESAKVRVGTSNVLVRCLSVGSRSARIQFVDSGKELDLQLNPDN